jgi:uncharacterized repeat protein (TIGR01451 family)
VTGESDPPGTGPGSDEGSTDGGAAAVTTRPDRPADRSASDDRTDSSEGVAAPAETAVGSDDDGAAPSATEVTGETTATTRLVDVVETNRWVGIDAVALVACGLGVLTRQPSLLLVGVLGVAYAAYGRGGPEGEASLTVERELSTATPDPGEVVRVTVRVHNEGTAALPDVRLVDGVPPALEVVPPDADDERGRRSRIGAPGNGSSSADEDGDAADRTGVARHGTALRPGRTATFSYAVRAVRGEHEWEPLRALVRDAPGTTERVHEADAASVLRCAPRLEATAAVPLRGLTTAATGRVATDVAGEGVEFTATREYRPGDPRKRVDWNRWARTGELSTVEFREERAASVVLLIDAREDAYAAPTSDARNAVERSVDAAAAAVPALLAAGDRVGLAGLGPAEAWLAPGAGDEHRARARRMLAAHPAFAPTPEEGRFFPAVSVRRLRRRLPAESQVIFCSPLIDDYAPRLARRLDAYGHPVTVLSPDPTGEATTGELLARAERRRRVRGLREGGIRVVDWSDGSLASALERANTRWG